MEVKEFRFSLFGESHGDLVGVLIEGCPPGIEVNEEEMKVDLDRRKGLSRFSTERVEKDEPEILSGVFNGKTTGTPITVIVKNKDVDSSFYEKIKDKPRPGHSDYTARVKYHGYNDYRGGGVFSGRLAVGTVIAGYFARKIINRGNMEVKAYIKSIGNIYCEDYDEKELFHIEFDFCPDEEAWEEMQSLMERIKTEGDSVGGSVKVVANNVVKGLGGPFDEDLASDLAKSFFSIPGVKGVEIGSGFDLCEMKGSEANDNFYYKDEEVVTETNNCGGLLGGISNGMPVTARIAFKPTPSIFKKQKTVDLSEGLNTDLKLKGRFDSCIAPKTLPIIEARMAIVLANHFMRWCSWKEFRNLERE